MYNDLLSKCNRCDVPIPIEDKKKWKKYITAKQKINNASNDTDMKDVT